MLWETRLLGRFNRPRLELQVAYCMSGLGELLIAIEDLVLFITIIHELMLSLIYSALRARHASTANPTLRQ